MVELFDLVVNRIPEIVGGSAVNCCDSDGATSQLFRSFLHETPCLAEEIPTALYVK
jgi:hypothetical protein